MSSETNKYEYNIGDGKMEYIQSIDKRELLIDAWKAITLTNNWDFVYEDTSKFILDNEPRNHEILQKMANYNPSYLKNNYKYCFRIVMRYMHYLARNGEEKFANFVNKN
jgi:hypothetical protein